MNIPADVLIASGAKLRSLADALENKANYDDLKKEINSRLSHLLKKSYHRFCSAPKPAKLLSPDIVVIAKSDDSCFISCTPLSGSSYKKDGSVYVDLLTQDGSVVSVKKKNIYLQPVHDYDLAILAIGLDQFQLQSFSGLDAPIGEDSTGPIYRVCAEVLAFDTLFNLILSVYMSDGKITLCETESAGDTQITYVDFDDYDGFLIKAILESMGSYTSLKLMDTGLADHQLKSIISILNI